MDLKESDIFLNDSSQVRHPWEVARLKTIKSILAPVMDQAAHGMTVLDLGCGDGYVVKQLLSDWKTSSFLGIDSAFRKDQISQFQADQHDDQISFYSNLSDVPQAKAGAVDLILLLDVLEHIEDDFAFIEEISSWIRKKGYVLITVPAYQALYCNHDRWLGHYRRYSQKTLLKLIKKAGFTPVMTGYFFSGLLLPRLCHKAMEILFKQEQTQEKGIGQWKWGRSSAHFVSVLLSLNAHLDVKLSKYGISQLGLSVFTLCRK